MTSNDDPFNNTPCDWPGCPARGNPSKDDGWTFWPFYYHWLPEGFYCPTHLEFFNAATAFLPPDSEEEQCTLRNADAEARRASFRVVHGHTDKES